MEDHGSTSIFELQKGRPKSKDLWDVPFLLAADSNETGYRYSSRNGQLKIVAKRGIAILLK